MEVLRGWSSRTEALVGFRRRTDRCAMGSGSQHLFLGLWLAAGQAFCFKVGNERLFIGLVAAKKTRSRRRRR